MNSKLSKGTRGFLCLLIILVLFSSVFLSGCAADGAAPKLKDAELNTPVISESGVLKVGVNTSLSPMAGMGNNKIIGIDVDVAGALADSLGLKLQIVDTGSTPSKSIESGDVDIALGVDSSETPKGTKLTDEYITGGVCLFALSSSSKSAPTTDSNPKIVAQTSSKSAWAVTNLFGKDSLQSTTDLTSAFQTLTSGGADYLAADAVVGQYAANRNNAEVKIVGMLENTTGYCCAVKETNTDLHAAITNALNNLVKTGIIDTIEKKWLGSTISLNGVSKIEKAGTSEATSADSSKQELSTSNSNDQTTAAATDINSVTS